MVPLKPLHDDGALSQAKLVKIRKWATEGILESLKPGKVEALRTRDDGTILNGHHRLKVLYERGIDVEALPREVVRREGS